MSLHLLAYRGTYNAHIMHLPRIPYFFADNPICQFAVAQCIASLMQIVCIFHGDWIDCRGASDTALVCNAV